ncbi:hypothetical protein [Singulisphaera sp. PoT]|uniref:hypothetical protein n=1 Tax=Singulisphaera sp. PoT TaxID=3411797 RepID=UPI003BF5DEC1
MAGGISLGAHTGLFSVRRILREQLVIPGAKLQECADHIGEHGFVKHARLEIALLIVGKRIRAYEAARMA